MSASLLGTVATWSQAFSIRTKIMGLAVGMVALMGTGAVVVSQSTFLDRAQAELNRRGASIARDIAARGTDHILTRDTFALNELLADTLRHNEDVRYILLLDGRGGVAGDTFGGAVPTDLLRLPWPGASQSWQVEALSTEEGLIRDVAAPLAGGAAGLVRVGMTEQRLRREAATLVKGMVLATLAMAAIGVTCAYLLTSFLIRPVLALVEVSQAVGAGDLSRRTGPGPPDEIGRLMTAFNRMVEQLSAARKVREELLDRVITAQEEERRRLARELHDETSQAISSLLVGLKSLEAAPPEPAVLRSRTAELRQLAAQTLAEIHHLVMELRPRSLDELGLAAALRHHVADFARKHDLLVDFQVLGAQVRLPPRVETCLYRIVQEALTNVSRHARATAASVVLDLRAELATAVVEDDGVGFDPGAALRPGNEKAALGLHGMQERAVLAGGTVQVESSPGGGTAIYVRIPIRREAVIDAGGEDTPLTGR